MGSVLKLLVQQGHKTRVKNWRGFVEDQIINFISYLGGIVNQHNG